MHFDDRLATVLRQRSPVGLDAGGRAARTQYRQLLDLLGRRKPVRGRTMAAEAWHRMNALSEAIPAAERAAIIREEARHLTSPELVTNLANAEPEVASAALHRAQLPAEDWEALIPRLPVVARGFLRFRTDLPPATTSLLDRLGIHDRGLPSPVMSGPAMPGEASVQESRLTATPGGQAVPPLAREAASPDNPSEIGKLVERIEAFQRARSERGAASPEARADPRLPLGDKAEEPTRTRIAAFGFTSDAAGMIDWASTPAGPMVWGAALADERGQPLAELRQMRPLFGSRVVLRGSNAIAGDWVVDASPRFTRQSGAFMGYAGRMRRPSPAVVAAGEPADANTHTQENNLDSEAGRIRQILHELRTPVNAIQGFAEVIQQQLFGPVPHQYRAHAATIAGDSAQILAGFDELDRLARLESGALEIEPGESDFASVIRSLVGQLQGVLAGRMAEFTEDIPDTPCLVGLDRREAEAIAWRLLATLANTASLGEDMGLHLTCDRDAMRLRIQLTTTLMTQKSIYESTAKPAGGILSAGVFGAGFALRLVRAESRAAGGDLWQDGEMLELTLPLLTTSDRGPSEERRAGPRSG